MIIKLNLIIDTDQFEFKEFRYDEMGIILSTKYLNVPIPFKWIDNFSINYSDKEEEDER